MSVAKQWYILLQEQEERICIHQGGKNRHNSTYFQIFQVSIIYIPYLYFLLKYQKDGAEYTRVCYTLLACEDFGKYSDA